MCLASINIIQVKMRKNNLCVKTILVFMLFTAVIWVNGITHIYAEETEETEEIEETEETEEIEEPSNTNKYYFSDVVNTGHNNGFSKKNRIKKNDPHYGWKLGEFVISGFTSQTKDDNGNIVFLKTVGDKITFTFNLEQDINKLNGNKNLSIASDKNGWDEEFQIKKTEFKKGTLIVKKTDYQNNEEEPQVYTDYLNGVDKGANTTIEVFEEGDYEIALDYEIFDDGFLFLNDYDNYRIRFGFSIRNGNCMVFPKDAVTGQELTNTSITENGFYLDLAKSRYLDINIKKEVLAEGSNGLTEDTRFNKPAKEGEKYTEEGIYTITAKNNQTEETTEKKIYVGNNSVMKAYMISSYSINDINSLLSSGATIDTNGNITFPEMEETTKFDDKMTSKNETKNNILFLIIPIIFVGAISGVVILKKRRKA